MHHFFITCPKGIVDLLVIECQQLGISQVTESAAGVEFSGTLEQAYRCCLWSRLASRVLIKLTDISADDYDALYTQCLDVPWSDHLGVDHSFAVDCVTAHGTMNNSQYALLKVKDAIVDHMRNAKGSRPSVERDHADVRINLYLDNRQSTLYLDLSGDPLHKRGYRQRTGVAPMRENLAAAILLRSKWHELLKDNYSLYDPMCGSGTILIEAALMAMNIAPGSYRTYFGFRQWLKHDESIWQKLITEAESLKIPLNDTIKMIGTDNSSKTIGIAKKNVQSAGLQSYIKLQVHDLEDCYPDLPGGKGLVVTNPPYGKRLEQVEKLKTTYFNLGRYLKACCPDWRASIFTSEDRLAKCIGFRSHHKNTLYNGALKCTLYHYHVRGHVKSDNIVQDESNEHALMFRNRLLKNMKHISKWAKKHDISCYRIYDADIPQYALAVDYYNGWVHLQEYEPPRSINELKALKRLDDALRQTAVALDIDPEHVIVKQRKVQSGSDQYNRLENKNHFMVIEENGLKFSVNLYDYLDTGIFLDHRNVRLLIRELSENKSFLNLFAYTATATVYAVAGGASSTTTVDMSNTYLSWARENLKLNYKLTPDHEFIRDDCFKWLQKAREQGNRYQLILLDPPTFSNSKKMDSTLDIQRDHIDLINKTLDLLTADGLLIFSCNARKFKLDETSLRDFFIQSLTAITTSEDFRRKPLHQCWGISKKPFDKIRLKT